MLEEKYQVFLIFRERNVHLLSTFYRPGIEIYWNIDIIMHIFFI